jgi:hypothetical protein
MSGMMYSGSGKSRCGPWMSDKQAFWRPVASKCFGIGGSSPEYDTQAKQYQLSSHLLPGLCLGALTLSSPEVSVLNDGTNVGHLCTAFGHGLCVGSQP